MKFMICPQCGIANFYVKNEKGERINVKVSSELEIIPVDTTRRIEDFNTNELFCLGCSWHGKITELKNYWIE